MELAGTVTMKLLSRAALHLPSLATASAEAVQMVPQSNNPMDKLYPATSQGNDGGTTGRRRDESVVAFRHPNRSRGAWPGRKVRRQLLGERFEEILAEQTSIGSASFTT
jgi:hypothetical protein